MHLRFLNNAMGRASNVILSLLILLAAGAVQAEENVPETTLFAPAPGYTASFKTLLQDVVENHPRIKSSLSYRNSVKDEEREEKAALYPQVDVGVDGRYRFLDNYDNTLENFDELNDPTTHVDAYVTVSQKVFDGGATFRKIDRARYAYAAAHADYEVQASEVVLTAIEAHYNYLVRGIIGRIREEALQRHRKILEFAQERFERGVGANRDVALARARLALAEQNLLANKIDFAEAAGLYEEIFGTPPANVKRPDIALSLPTSQEDALKLGLLNSPLLSSATSQVMASRASMESEEASRWPGLSLQVTGTRYDLDRDSNDYDVQARLQMNYALYTGGAQTARIKRSTNQYAQARANEETIHREFSRQLKVSWEKVENQKLRVMSQEKSVEANRLSRDLFQEQFETTGGSILSLLEAEDDYRNSLESYVQGLMDQELFQYQLLHDMGTLLSYLNLRLTGTKDGGAGQ
ncbi:TolC family protein [Emcibacter nanhaiensis]|uniref:TolC family outer membrane protein n=1 Tax=Emcibacter nanhaiensis TaxID=1505037 RepID=A0A501PRR6_9PROT|nr:TolC family protein [Emcibacter nanhaiensis]TPD63220.1 hypothetical protein FIV46_03860 [Emcibacter nanhaiensis]